MRTSSAGRAWLSEPLCCWSLAHFGRALTAQAPAPSAPLPHVHFVATGGTISNRDGGRLTAEELTKSMPGVDRYARVTYEQFATSPAAS